MHHHSITLIFFNSCIAPRSHKPNAIAVPFPSFNVCSTLINQLTCSSRMSHGQELNQSTRQTLSSQRQTQSNTIQLRGLPLILPSQGSLGHNHADVRHNGGPDPGHRPACFITKNGSAFVKIQSFLRDVVTVVTERSMLAVCMTYQHPTPHSHLLRHISPK